MDLPPALLNGVGVTTLLVILFWMLAREHLVTGPAHRRELADKDAQIDRLTNAVDVKDQQLEKLTVVGEAVVKILASVDEMAKGHHR